MSRHAAWCYVSFAPRMTASYKVFGVSYTETEVSFGKVVVAKVIQSGPRGASLGRKGGGLLQKDRAG